jgi:hypothetical protein
MGSLPGLPCKIEQKQVKSSQIKPNQPKSKQNQSKFEAN